MKKYLSRLLSLVLILAWLFPFFRSMPTNRTPLPG